MPHLDPAFAEEFHVDRDPRMLALDFWSYLNARQANLGWSERDHRLWWHLELALSEVKPVLLDPKQERFGPYLEGLVGRWRAPAESGSAPPGAAEEAQQVRRELAEMLEDALRRGRAERSGATLATVRPVATSGPRP